MLAHFPSNCSLISTSLTRCVVSNGTTFTEQVCRCVPNMEAHSIRLYALGHTSNALDSELSELQAANDAGRLEIIHGQPFITLPKDDPCADLFDTLSYTPAPQKHKPLPPCHSSPHLQQCEQLSLFKFHLPN